MPKLGPTKRRDVIRHLHELGFDGPFAGGNHEYMEKGKQRVPIPNPHQGDISLGLLKKILITAGISVEEWESL
jgi:predicted RNA binding protein YcfA (HicA-like mRNA interferase family)